MTPLEVRDETWQRLDYTFLQNGHVVLFRGSEVLATAVAGLTDLGYRIVRLDARTWTTEQMMHRQLAGALAFPSYYGHNLDAFNDCLSDVATYEYGSDPQSAGLVLVLDGYDTFALSNRQDAEVLVDVFASVARYGLLFSNRMLCLLRVDDPAFAMPPVGAAPVLWNPHEVPYRTRRA